MDVLVPVKFVVAVHVSSAVVAPGQFIGGAFLHDALVVEIGIDWLGEAH